MGDGSGVAVDHQGIVLAFHRATRQWVDPLPTDPIEAPTLIAFDAPLGRTVRQWGAGTFAMPHGISVDNEGNTWITDIALHQVFKLSADGRLLLTLGERGTPGNDDRHFNRPTDVLVLPDGSFYVADGYGNTRIMKFDRTGQFQFQWGRAGNGEGEFKTPHSLTLTSSGDIAVADRNNSRIQIFDLSGRFKAQWRLPDLLRPFAIAPLPGKRLVVVGNTGRIDNVPEVSAGFITTEEGRVLTRFGGYGRSDGAFIAVHDVATDSTGNIYAINVSDARVQKFRRCGF